MDNATPTKSPSSLAKLSRIKVDKRLVIRCCIAAVALTINSFGLALTARNGWGGDSMNMFFNATARLLGLSPGNVYSLFNGSLLLVGFWVAHESMGVGSIIHLLFFGSLIDLWSRILEQFSGAFELLPWQLVFALLGLVTHACGNGLFIACRMGIPGFESMLFKLAAYINKPYKLVKVTSDLIYFITALLMGGVYGVMTLVFAFCAGPAISFFITTLNRVLLTPLGIGDPRNQLDKKHS